ncbi:hypothetical protein NQ317_014033 [Molorchus minor]|uniref:Guanylate kinase-like domain-containing protein n=1 Tax=Molorchus minor TaxID=1323400 RepID=A0ABQ9JWP6_9CUCU|nr:hypothetical protein NQ317_014033 [Molorchus minor]
MADSNNLRPLLICGPSGSDFPLASTRQPRPGEVHGEHYHFTDEETMKKGIENGEFIEHAVFSGNYYGTSRAAINEISNQGSKTGKNTDLYPWSVFIKPPSLEALKQRLIDRKTETNQSLNRRLSRADDEIKYGTSGNFDLVIVNDDIDTAYDELKKFVVDNKTHTHWTIPQLRVKPPRMHEKRSRKNTYRPNCEHLQQRRIPEKGTKNHQERLTPNGYSKKFNKILAEGRNTRTRDSAEQLKTTIYLSKVSPRK